MHRPYELSNKRGYHNGNAFNYLLAKALLFFFVCQSLTGCVTSSPTISLEQAKKISIEFQGRPFTAPHRKIDDLEDILSLSKGDVDCDDRPVRQLTEREMLASQLLTGCKGSQDSWCAVYTLRRHAMFYMSLGQFSEALRVLEMANTYATGKFQYLAELVNPLMSQCYARTGDFVKAKLYSSNKWSNYRKHAALARLSHQTSKAIFLNQQCRYEEAEGIFRETIRQSEKGEHSVGYWDSGVERVVRELYLRIDLAENLFFQGRYNEAEIVLRKVLAHPFGGRFPIRRAGALRVLAKIFYEQGKFSEAAITARSAVNSYIDAEAHCSSLYLNDARRVLARALIGQQKWDLAIDLYDAIRKGMRQTSDAFQRLFAGDPDWTMALLATDNTREAKKLLDAAIEKVEEKPEIYGLMGVWAKKQRDKRAALASFQKAVIGLSENTQETGLSGEEAKALDQRWVYILEHYLMLMEDLQTTKSLTSEKPDFFAQSFQVVQLLRDRTLQRDIIAASIRAKVGAPELKDLLRRAQDAHKQISALRATLSTALAQTEQNHEVLQGLQAEIAALLEAYAVIAAEIQKQFPEYAKLVAVKPLTLDETLNSLHNGEALISFYVGRQRSFVWVLNKTGRRQFFAVDQSYDELAKSVTQIRASLAPAIDSLDMLPDFDLTRAHAIYASYLKPARSVWGDTQHLIVVPHGPFGYLPLSVLPQEAGNDGGDGQLLFDRYRQVPWLIRHHRISTVPSIGALASLRSQANAPVTKRSFAGFGDPVFSKAYAAPDTMTSSRAVLPQRAGSKQSHSGFSRRAIRRTTQTSLDDASLSDMRLDMLLPLPDTREEILAIAATMNADSESGVFLGLRASETMVIQTDLSDRQVLVFATHGLVPGDINGLHQPALALSSPTVTGEKGSDGLLTMSEIMGLRLNADWVVLSACNTAAADGEGSEAVTGLGRAFFYAGARTLLVTNWPVESSSAKLLTTHLFQKVADHPQWASSQALQDAMLNLINKGVFRDPGTGKPLFTYAHPIFWAPFSIVGEGGKGLRTFIGVQNSPTIKSHQLN